MTHSANRKSERMGSAVSRDPGASWPQQSHSDVVAAQMKDRVGLGWRPEIAAGIFAELDRIDVVEVIADDYFHVSRLKLSALRTLAAQVPITLHGIGAGMASTVPTQATHLDAMARLVNELEPEAWSEHLAFVRGGGHEIGHLAAPSRTQTTVDATADNLSRARNVVGCAPQMENIATLIDPPGSMMDEAEWLSAVLANSQCSLLLDLHNLYANSVNFGFSASEFLGRLPLHRIGAIHIAGGKWISSGGESRLLDDHLHPVPDPVYDLLSEVAARAEHPLTVILERDGAFPAMDQTLRELGFARLAMARGRGLKTQRQQKEREDVVAAV